jgi:HD-GYP domain-containing protein (c-di-GMP phosphodiesterase class II)
MTKRIPIAQLKPGMFVVGLDKSWWQTPFLSHKWTVRGPEDIQKLVDLDVHEVVIDPTHGDDVVEISPAPPVETEETPQEIQLDAPATPPAAPPPAPSLALPEELSTVAAGLPAARAARDEAVAILSGIFEGVKIGKPIDSPALKQAVGGLLDTILHRPEASLILMQMQQFETELLAHAVDVCVLSLLIGQQQELAPEQLEALGVGAMLHDVGKTRLPRNLLRKSGGYNPQAQKLLNEHPRLGVSLLTHNKSLPEEALRIVAEHHEYADGSGFPEGRMATKLSPLGQIVAIINLYSGFVSGHDGQSTHLPTQALRRLYQLGRDGKLMGEHVAWAIRALGVYPIGAVVELNTGERGIIVATNSAEAQKPAVLVVCDTEGQQFAVPRLVNLAATAPHEPVHTILRPLESTAIPTSLANYFRDTL